MIDLFPTFINANQIQMNFNLFSTTTKEELFNSIYNELTGLGFNIVLQDTSRPWGGFFLIDESQVTKFIVTYFNDTDQADIRIVNNLSPKILVVAPKQRLSWQYHLRRSEIWKVIADSDVAIKSSNTDTEPINETILATGSVIKLEQGVRHRLIGLDSWGIVAEIWQHTNSTLSNEDDIIRVQDDYSR